MAKKTSPKAKQAQKAFFNAVSKAEKTMTKLHALTSVELNSDVPVLMVANENAKTAAKEPLVPAHIEDAAAIGYEKRMSLGLGADDALPDHESYVSFRLRDIVHHNDLMVSLTLPHVNEKNIAAVWEKNLSKILLPGDSYISPRSPEERFDPLWIAEGGLTTLAATTLRVRYNKEGKSTDVSVHIVRNNARNQTLIVGERMPAELKAAFAATNTIYVNRNTKNAAAEVQKALESIVSGLPAKAGENLRLAVNFRNDLTSADRRSLAELLVDGKIQPMSGKYVVKGLK